MDSDFVVLSSLIFSPGTLTAPELLYNELFVSAVSPFVLDTFPYCDFSPIVRGLQTAFSCGCIPTILENPQIHLPVAKNVGSPTQPFRGFKEY